MSLGAENSLLSKLMQVNQEYIITRSYNLFSHIMHIENEINLDTSIIDIQVLSDFGHIFSLLKIVATELLLLYCLLQAYATRALIITYSNNKHRAFCDCPPLKWNLTRSHKTSTDLTT